MKNVDWPAVITALTPVVLALLGKWHFKARGRAAQRRKGSEGE